MSIQTFARHEKRNGPMNAVLHARFPEPIVSFVKTTALVEGVSESTVLRFALEQWATAGFPRKLLIKKATAHNGDLSVELFRLILP